MPSPQSAAARILGERVKDARTAKGLSQEDAAALAEMHVTNFGKIERGQANPSLTTIVRIAGVLEIDPGTLVRGIKLGDLPPRSHQLTATDLIKARKAQAG
ncbi:XRE family transcriptional regulator [Agromyces protaetiae]|uniref:XRE family transcriptional regulator n=1 Tax=Agromyces protaetiae TaxID=2509455 RepID=A0A4V0YH65_9MICO|nr:helix-turn-helix transcriptional regulator [Agromyces protaetiae]QAY73631.1 XRE family transcriptional regulator [Agromyces protaetiae]